MEPLTADDIVRIEHRARRFQGAYTGTSGTLAADVIRLLEERRRLLVELARLQERLGHRWADKH
jgi:regulator of replication initiation timing